MSESFFESGQSVNTFSQAFIYPVHHFLVIIMFSHSFLSQLHT